MPSRRCDRRVILLLCFIAPFALSGCPHAALSYHLAQQGPQMVLFPPSVAPVPITADFETNIKNARSVSPQNPSCDIDAGPILVHWAGKVAQVIVKADSFYANQTVRVEGDPRPRIYLDSVQDLEAFRASVRNLESSGCLRPGDPRRFLGILTDYLPLPPSTAYVLRYGSYEIAGALDLTAGFQLQLGSPVYAPGASPTADRPLGHEDAAYIFKPAPAGGRVQIQLASAIETLDNGTTVQESKPHNEISFPQGFGFFRLLLRDRSDVKASASMASIFFAEDAAKLDQVTAQLQSTALDPCTSVSLAGVTCISVPARFGVSFAMAVRVNGKNVCASTLAEALDTGIPSKELLKSLQVKRWYQGRLVPIKFDPADKSILGLKLMPNDEITWRSDAPR
jgi:hypothetical protein